MSGAPVLECEVGLVRLGLLEKWGDKLPLLSFDGHDYLIGSHIAELLKRETFNLYGSLKRRKIQIWQAPEPVLKLLISRGSVYLGTTSVSLVRLSEVEEFVTDALAEDARRTERRKGPVRKAAPSPRARSSKPARSADEQPDLEMLITALEEQHRRGGTEWGELQEDPHVENEHVGILPPTIVDLKRRKVVEFDEMDEESSSSSSVSLKEGQDVEWHGSAKETKRRKNVRAREGDRMRQSVRGADQVAERLAEMRKEQRHTDHDINKD